MNNTDNLFKTKKDRNDFIISLIVILVFIVFVFTLSKSGFKEDSLLKTKDKLNTTLVEQDSIPLVEQDSIPLVEQDSIPLVNSESVTKYQDSTVAVANNAPSITPVPIPANDSILTKIKDNIPPVNSTDQNPTDNELKNNLSNSVTKDDIKKDTTYTLKDVTFVENDKTITNSIANETQEEVTKKINSVPLNKTNKIKENTVEKVLNEPKTITKENKTKQEIDRVKDKENTKDCIIVVGAYRDKKNLQKTINSLENNGYTVVVGVLNNNMHYTGVPIDCKENRSTKAEKMNKLNTIFNVSSWILKNR